MPGLVGLGMPWFVADEGVDVPEKIDESTPVGIHAARMDAANPLRSTGALVHARLLADIVELRFTPGQKLSENALAAEYGVSRTPVREALLQLRRSGLVKVNPQVGTIVAKIDLDRFFEAQFIREALELGCIELIVRADRRPSRAEVSELRRFLTQQRKAAQKHDLREFTRLDESMHSRICAMSGHRHVWETIAVSKSHLDRVRHMTLATRQIMNELIKEHSRIIDAIAEPDREEARRAVRFHARGTLRVIASLVDRNPEYFDPTDLDRPGSQHFLSVLAEETDDTK